MVYTGDLDKYSTIGNLSLNTKILSSCSQCSFIIIHKKWIITMGEWTVINGVYTKKSSHTKQKGQRGIRKNYQEKQISTKYTVNEQQGMVDDLQNTNPENILERENEDITNQFKIINKKFNKKADKENTNDNDDNEMNNQLPNNNIWVKRKTEYKRLMVNSKKKKAPENVPQTKPGKNGKNIKNKASDKSKDDEMEDTLNGEMPNLENKGVTDDDIIEQNPKDLLAEELGQSQDNNDQMDAPCFNIFDQILSSNSAFDRKSKPIPMAEDKIEFIDENKAQIINNSTIKMEHQFEQEQQKIREEIQNEKQALVKEEVSQAMVNEFTVMMQENARINERIEEEEEFVHLRKMADANTLPSAFKTADEVDLSLKRVRKDLPVDFENDLITKNKDMEQEAMNDQFSNINQEQRAVTNEIEEDKEQNRVEEEIDLMQYNRLGLKLKFVKNKSDKPKTNNITD